MNQSHGGHSCRPAKLDLPSALEATSVSAHPRPWCAQQEAKGAASFGKQDGSGLA